MNKNQSATDTLAERANGPVSNHSVVNHSPIFSAARKTNRRDGRTVENASNQRGVEAR